MSNEMTLQPAAAVTSRTAVQASRVFWLLLVALTAISLAWCALSIANGAGLTHESGVVSGLAVDLHRGLFYRPLFGPAGYGGTRYGPAFILLQAGLMSAGLPVIAAGHIVCVGAEALLLAGVFVLLRRLGLRPALAAMFPMLLFVGQATTSTLTGIRADFLATAFDVWGLVCIAGLGKERDRHDASAWLLVAAAACFAIALVTKINCGFGLAAAGLWLLSRRRIGAALVLGLLTIGLTAAALAWLNHLSDGRLWENYRACADTSGRPRLSAMQWIGILLEVMVRDDWPGALVVLAAVAAWATGSSHQKRSLAGLFLIVSLVLTLPMFFSPGLGVNQMLDLQVAAVLYLGASWPVLKAHAIWPSAMAAIAGVALVFFVQKLNLSRARYPRTDTFRMLVAQARPASGPIFSDNAMVPVAVGQSPFLLDDFMFPAVRHAVPGAEQDLYRRLDHQFFGAVILRYDPKTGDRPVVFGKGFAPHLLANYQLVARWNVWDHLWIYRPKGK